MDKDCKIILRPTKEYPAFAMSTGRKEAFGHKRETAYGWIDQPIRTPHQLFHVYVLHKQPRKKGDWSMYLGLANFYGNIRKETTDIVESDWYKIVATTNPDFEGIVPTVSMEFLNKYEKLHNSGDACETLAVQFGPKLKWSEMMEKMGKDEKVDATDANEIAPEVDDNGNIIINMNRIEVGDLVVPTQDSGFILHCGTGTYQHAVVISLDPFILTSLDSTMRWSATIKQDFFESIGKAKPSVLNNCMRRLDS